MVYIQLIIIFIFLTLSCTNEKIEFKPNNVEVEFESKMTDRNKYLNDKYEKYIDMTEGKVGNDVALFPTLTKKQVEQDLDFFLYAIQTRYALYDRFGGDEEFLKRKKLFLEEIKDKELITSNEYIDLFKKHFSNIEDIHLRLGSIRFFDDIHYTYIYNGYLNKKEVSKLNDIDKEKYLRYTLDEKGNIRYTLVYVSNQNEKTHILKLILKNGKTKEYVLKKIGTKTKKTEEFYETEKYIYFRNSSFFNDRYKKYKDIIKDKDVLFDFRNNIGGIMFLLNYILNNYYENSELVFSSNRLGKLMKDVDSVAWYYVDEIKQLDKIKRKNNNKKYILVNSDTASAGELVSIRLKIVDYENTIILGTNTRGTLVGNYTNKFTLPNSNLNLKFGASLYNKYKDIDEGRGIMPDIWLDTSDPNVLDRIDKYIIKN